MTTGITLDVLFTLQDKAAAYNLAQSKLLPTQVQFVRNAISLSCDLLPAMRFPLHKQHSLRVLSTDCMASIVTSTRVGLWGNLPDSIVLQRAALETATILTAVVNAREYQVLTHELTTGLNRYSFENARANLGDFGRRIGALWGKLSNVGAHSTQTRLKFSSYEMDGKEYDRLGAAMEAESAELALSLVPDVCVQLLATLEDA
jgi:hypothetical protein